MNVYEKKHHLIGIVASDLSIRSGFLMTTPTEWIHFQNTTIEVAQLTWVCVCGHTRFTQQFKVRAD